MNIIKFPLIKTEDAFGKAIYELPHGVVLGHDGENLTTEIRIIPDEIITGASYRLELNNGQGTELERKDDYLYAYVKAEMLTVGDIEAQLVWTWNDRVEGENVNKTDTSNIAHWRVLDSIKLSEDLEEAHPEILNQILADIAEIKEYGGGGSGRPGVDGEDGFSPEISVDAVEGGYQLTITNKDADPTVITIYNGKDGKDGVDGKDGQNGLDGKDGQNGLDGKDGQDGFSPTIETEAVENGYQMTITNKDAEPTVIVLQNGQNGKDGKDGQNGKDGQDYVFTDADCQTVAAYVYAMFEDGDTLTY